VFFRHLRKESAAPVLLDESGPLGDLMLRASGLHDWFIAFGWCPIVFDVRTGPRILELCPLH
jgi:hypothetical protein